MSDPQALARRLEAVEAALAHQDRVVEELNRVVVDQWKAIDTMKRRLDALGDRVQEAEYRAGLAGPPEPPPPHY